MADGFINAPKVLHGAFVEFGVSIPPLFVAFQFNPVQLTRNRSLTFTTAGAAAPKGSRTATTGEQTLRRLHARESSLRNLQKKQVVTVQEQTIGFDIRLDATDRLADRDAITEEHGIGPQLSTLELMVYPKEESLLGQGAGALLGQSHGFSFTRGQNPPLILFVFGRKRVLPVNITAMNITESEFSTDLNPVRATVAVNLTVIEGSSVPYLYSKAMTEATSVLNLANAADAANVVLPG